MNKPIRMISIFCLMLFLALITLANMSTAADPAPALAGFLDSVR